MLSLKVVLKEEIHTQFLEHQQIPTALLTQKQNRERLCCIFPGSLLEYKKQIDKIFTEETAMLMESKSMRNTFKNIKISAVVKNKSSIKNLVVKTKL